MLGERTGMRGGKRKEEIKEIKQGREEGKPEMKGGGTEGNKG